MLEARFKELVVKVERCLGRRAGPCELVQEAEVRRLVHAVQVSLPGKKMREKGGKTHTVCHCFKLDASGRTSRDLGRLDNILIDPCRIPERIARVTEDPE